MAYKFQLGPARLSGSTLYKNGLDVSGSLTIEDPTSLAGAGLARNGTTLDLDIDELTALGGATIDQADNFLVSDAGTEKKVTFSNLEDSIFGNVSGDATIAAGGALTIANDAVEQAMIADDAVGADQLASDAVVEASIVDNAVTLAKMAGITRGSLIVGDASGDPSYLAKGTAAQFLQSDGNDPVYVSVSGQATVASGGALSLAAAAITGQTEMTGDVADTDELMISDDGTLKRLDFSVLRDAVFNDVSGDATVAAGGALTIGADAVESGMLNDNVISGQSALGSAAAAQDDELLFSDDGTLKKITFSNLEDSIFGNVSGDATVAAGGALTIAAGAVEEGMLNDNVISGQAELAAADIADADEMLISDGGTLKKVGIDSLATFFRGMSVTAIGDANGALAEGLNYGNAPITQNRDWVLPDAPAVGDQVIVKAPQVGSGVSITVKVDVGTSHKIDGNTLTSVSLEEDGAAVTLVYAADDLWLLV
jgi:hypothetical protein